MNKLIKFFNEKYGNKYGKISYPRTTMQIYRVYQSIKSYGIKDEELVKLLHNIKLPKPKSIEEKELYTDCLYNKDDSEMVIDTSNLISKENPVFTGSISLGRKEGSTIGGYSVAIGYDTEASGYTSHAEGQFTTASEYCSHAEGCQTIASGVKSHAEGDSTTASNSFSHAEGNHTKANGESSHAEGFYTEASGDSSHAEGSNTTALSDCQHVQGKYNIEDTEGKYAHIVGNGTNTSKSNAHTLDWNGNGWYAGDIQANNVPHVISEKVVLTVPAASITAKKAEIDNLTDDSEPVEIKVNGSMTFDPTKSYYLKYNNKEYQVLVEERMGVCFEDECYCGFMPQESTPTIIIIILTLDTTNITDMQLIEKDIKKLDNMYMPNDLKVNNSITLCTRKGMIGAFSSSFGASCEASGNASHAEGNETTASGETSHAEGDATTASGSSSHAEGDATTASGSSSHAEGSGTTALGVCSHAEGSGTIASGRGSHAEGNNNTASGNSSHSEGKYNGASGDYSHAEGYNTTASGKYQHVQGKYNIEDTANKYAHIVGNGSSRDNKSNAHTLDWNGNAWFAGRVEGTNLPYVVSSKVLTTVPASDIKLNDEITVNNISINKDRKYYIEFLGSKNLCNVVISEIGNQLTCAIGNYAIQGITFSSNLMLGVHKISADDTAIDTFTDLVIYEEEIKCLDNKYLENDLRVQNSISLGRVGNIGTGSSAIGMVVEASGMGSHAEGYGAKATGNFSHAEGSGTEALKEDAHAEGNNTIASSMYQHVQGKNNIEDAEGKYAHIVGNGEDFNNRANAHTLDWKGNAWYAGKLSQEGVPTENKDLITKKYFDDGISSLPQISFNENGELVVTINGVSKIFVPKS